MSNIVFKVMTTEPSGSWERGVKWLILFLIGGTHCPSSAAESERGHGRADSHKYVAGDKQVRGRKQVRCMWGHCTRSCSRQVLQSRVLIGIPSGTGCLCFSKIQTCISLHTVPPSARLKKLGCDRWNLPGTLALISSAFNCLGVKLDSPWTNIFHRESKSKGKYI